MRKLKGLSMRYFTVGLFFSVISSFSGFAQDLILKHNDVVVNNDSIYLSGTQSTELIEIKLSVTNNRSTAVSIKLKKTEIQLMEGTECSFCWGECYTPAVFVSPMAITIQPGATDRNSFVGDYRPFGIEGTTIVKYTFFSPADTSWQQSVTVFFQIGGSGVDSRDILRPVIAVFPNPANRMIQIRFDDGQPVSRTVTLVDMQGRPVLSATLAAGCNTVDWPVEKLPSGIYFLQTRDENGYRSARKISIRH
jgi:hypothetical protein